MNQFDQFVKQELEEKYYIRYADDFVFLSTSKLYLECLLPIVEDFLCKKLRLRLHPEKIFLQTLTSGIDFLGWVHFPDHRVLRTATKRRMLRNLAGEPSEATRASYLGMLGHGNAQGLYDQIA
jgi:RNA-directed DNA polymerase